MDDRDILRQQRLERVQTFGNENSGDWPATSAATIHFGRVNAILRDLTAARVGQQRAPAAKQTLLDALWLDFKNIARTARAIALDEPGFAGAYRLPQDDTETAITTHADALLRRLEDNDAPVASGGDTAEQKAAKSALRAKFVAYFIAPDFVEDLRADRSAVDEKNRDKTAGNLEGVRSTRDIESLLEQARGEVTRLDAMMQNLYARDPGKLRAWLAASRVERSPRRGKEDGGSSDGRSPAANPPAPNQ